ncbi:hypothetical protein V6N13_146338 [Hibiscus sabdariffa]|uniref:Uncharacterized protein n=1 Tax=Hibiscus sabdariffa TaxID=183260 RepID=A0ABR2TSC5_9ROSI
MTRQYAVKMDLSQILKRKECLLLLVENADWVFKINPRSISFDLARCFLLFFSIFESWGKLVSRRQQIFFFFVFRQSNWVYVAVQRNKEFLCWH